MSRFYALLEAVEAALTVQPVLADQIGIAGGRAISASISTAIDISLAGAKGARVTYSGPVNWHVMIDVELYARSRQVNGIKAADPLLENVYAKLASGVEVGQQHIDLGEPDIIADVGEAGEKTGWLKLTYLCIVRTNNGSLV